MTWTERDKRFTLMPILGVDELINFTKQIGIHKCFGFLCLIKGKKVYAEYHWCGVKPKIVTIWKQL